MKDERLLQVHEEAVSKVLDHIMENIIYTRIQKDGETKLVKTGNAVILRVTHLTSRPTKHTEGNIEEKLSDPQIHTHSLIANITLCSDKQYRTVDFKPLYEHKMHIGEIYRLELARGAARCGYEIDINQIKEFNFELRGVTKEDIKIYSKRRRDIVNEANAQGVSLLDAKALSFIAKTTREKKDTHTLEELESKWQKLLPEKRLQALNSIKEASLKAGNQLLLTDEEVQRIGKEALQYATDHLSESEAVLGMKDVYSCIIEYAGIKLGIVEMSSEIKQGKSTGALIEGNDKDINAYTTRESIRLEQQNVKLMRSLQNNARSIMTKIEVSERLERLNEALEKSGSITLNQEQKDAVSLMLNTRDKIVGVQGISGAGKTTMLQAARDILREQGLYLIGLAPTKKAVDTIRTEVGIEALTLSLFIARYEGVLAGRGTAEGREAMIASLRNAVIVLDEASMVSSTQMRDLQVLVKKLKLRVFALGDTRQKGSRGNGKPFYYLQDQGMNTVIMREIQRQKTPDLLEAVYMSESAVDQERSKSIKIISQALKTLGTKNIIDIKKEKKLKASEEKKGQGQPNASKDTKLQSERITNAEYAEDIYKIWLESKAKITADMAAKGEEIKYITHKQILVVVPSNPLRRLVNSMLRQNYISGDSIVHTILEPKNLSRAQMTLSQKYEKGNILLFSRTDEQHKAFGIKSGDYFRVDKVVDGKLHIVRNKDNHSIMYDPSLIRQTKSGAIAVFNTAVISLEEGERIIWTKNSQNPRHKFIVNGGSAKIVKIIGNMSLLKLPSGKFKLMSLKNSDMQHIDLAYCLTTSQAQSTTTNIVIGALRAKEIIDLSTLRDLYLILGRAKHHAKLVIDDYEKLIKKLADVTGDKTSAIKHLLRTPAQAKDGVDLKSQLRSVRMYKDRLNYQESQKEHERRMDEVSIKAKANRWVEENKANYGRFIKDPGKIHNAAMELFGMHQFNKQLSKCSSIRFGKKGHIAVNLETGVWHDFKSGEGGSVFTLAKQTGLLKDRGVGLLSNTSATTFSSKSETKEKEKELKIARVEKIVSKSTHILDREQKKEKNLAWFYLTEHRKIKLDNIKLSQDVRFTTQAWSSETKSEHSALLSIAKDINGKATAVQMTYLNLNTGKKNTDLERSKISQGVITGSFVELTTNIESKHIFIAEGVETALSIAQAVPNGRVICSLGITNIKGFDIPQVKHDKHLIICADNDENSTNSITRFTVEKAALELENKGFKSVTVIMPDEAGKDFNDILKIWGTKGILKYVSPILQEPRNYKEELQGLTDKICKLKLKEASLWQNMCNLNIYKAPKGAIARGLELIDANGIEATREIKQNPEILGELKGFTLFGLESVSRVNGRQKLEDILKHLANFRLTKNLKTSFELRYESLKASLMTRLKPISKFKTHDLGIDEIERAIEKPVLHALMVTDRQSSYSQVKHITSQVAESIVRFRARYGKEPNNKTKLEFFLRVRFEAEREPRLRNWLEENVKHPGSDKSLERSLALSQKLERLLYIDSSLAKDKDKLYYAQAPSKDVIKLYNIGERKIHSLTQMLMKRSMSFVKANFIASEVVKHEERTGAHMSLKQKEALSIIGDYVHNNYHELVKYGFSQIESKMIYKEGSKLVLNYQKPRSNIHVPAFRLNQIQKATQQSYEAHQRQSITTAAKSVDGHRTIEAKHLEIGM